MGKDKHTAKSKAFYTKLLYVNAFLDLFAVGLIIPLIPAQVRGLGASQIFIGLLGSFYCGFQLASGPLIGTLSDLKGRVKVFIWTLLACSVSYFIIGITGSMYIVLAMRVVLGICKHTQMLTKALVPDYEKDEAGQSAIYGKMASISGVGMTIGPVVGGHIVEDIPGYGFVICACMTSALFIANAVIVTYLPDDTVVTKTQESKEKKASVIKTPIQVLSGNIKQALVELKSINWKLYWDVFFFKALISFCMGIYYSNYALYLKTQFLLSPKQIGYTISFQSVITSICSYLIEYVNRLYANDYDFTMRNMHVFVLLVSSMVGLAASSSMYTYVIFLIPLAIANAVGRLVTLEMVIQKSAAEHRGSMIGASNSVRSISGVLAPATAGFIGEYFGVPSVLYASIWAAFVGLVISVNVRLNRPVVRSKDD